MWQKVITTMNNLMCIIIELLPFPTVIALFLPLGRLVIDSVGVFSGYMNDPDKSSEALTDDGWYLTSDAGYIDADDHLIVVGR